MKYANQISEILNAFSPAPLKKEQMTEFYCADTMEYRTSDKYDSPIEDLADICRNPKEYSACLLLGHRGCGKSTELNRMSENLAKEGYKTRTINCSLDLDLFNIVHSDLFILMGEALLEIAEELGCEIRKPLLERIENFWMEGTETMLSKEAAGITVETGTELETKGIFVGLLNLFAKVKTDLKFNEETRKEYRKKISVRTSEWIGLLGEIAEEITEKTGGKRPILIYQKSLQVNIKVLGNTHPFTATGYNNLARVYYNQGKYQEAEKLFLRGLQINKKTLGEEHPSTIVNYHNLASVYRAKGENTNALLYFFRAYQSLPMEPEPGYPDRKGIYKELEAVYFKMNPQGNLDRKSVV